MDDKTLASFGKIEIVALTPMKVASCKITSSNPEEEGYLFMANWLKKQGLKYGENGVRNFWNYMFAWLENSDEKARLTNGGTCEETPCLEEVYIENGVEYMAMYLPLQEGLQQLG